MLIKIKVEKLHKKTFMKQSEREESIYILL